MALRGEKEKKKKAPELQNGSPGGPKGLPKSSPERSKSSLGRPKAPPKRPKGAQELHIAL